MKLDHPSIIPLDWDTHRERYTYIYIYYRWRFDSQNDWKVDVVEGVTQWRQWEPNTIQSSIVFHHHSGIPQNVEHWGDDQQEVRGDWYHISEILIPWNLKTRTLFNVNVRNWGWSILYNIRLNMVYIIICFEVQRNGNWSLWWVE